MDNSSNKNLPSYYGDLLNFGASLINRRSEEDQSTSISDVSLVLNSEANLEGNENEQQFWADNELESTSSSLLQQGSTNPNQSNSQQRTEKLCSAGRPVTNFTANAGSQSAGRKSMIFTAIVPQFSGQIPSSTKRSKLKRRLLRLSLTSSSSSGESNISINNAPLSSTPNDLKYQRNSELCWRCKIHSKNAVFVHGVIGHQCYCYRCALKLWRMNGRCPMCHQYIRKIIKVVGPKLNSDSKIIKRSEDSHNSL